MSRAALTGLRAAISRKENAKSNESVPALQSAGRLSCRVRLKTHIRMPENKAEIAAKINQPVIPAKAGIQGA